jgi:hypothetical protein
VARQKILIQLDPDPHASVFDAVVAIDADVDRLLQYDRVELDQIRDLVHGAIFTRGSQELHNTAIFIGGSDVAAGEALLTEVTRTFFGPLRVSVLLDANGCNTTAAAAVLAAAKHTPLAGATATVLGGTGPVGQRVARLLAAQGASVRIGSRTRARAEEVCRELGQRLPGAALTPHQCLSESDTAEALRGAQIVIAAGAAGVELLSADVLRRCASLRVAIDLNAVPPSGIGGIEATDKGRQRDGAFCYGAFCYGAIGVGGTKIKIHRAAIARLFTASDLVLDAEEVLQIGQELGQP